MKIRTNEFKNNNFGERNLLFCLCDYQWDRADGLGWQSFFSYSTEEIPSPLISQEKIDVNLGK